MQDGFIVRAGRRKKANASHFFTQAFTGHQVEGQHLGAGDLTARKAILGEDSISHLRGEASHWRAHRFVVDQAGWQRRVQQVAGQMQPKQKHSLASAVTCLPEYAIPIELRTRSNKLGDVTNPSKLGPAVLRSVCAEEEDEVFRAQARDDFASDRDLLQPIPELTRVYRRREVAPRDSPLQLYEHSAFRPHKSVLVIVPEKCPFLGGRELMERGISRLDQGVLGPQHVGRTNQ